jgi:hypothetical protein
MIARRRHQVSHYFAIWTMTDGEEAVGGAAAIYGRFCEIPLGPASRKPAISIKTPVISKDCTRSEQAEERLLATGTIKASRFSKPKQFPRENSF